MANLYETVGLPAIKRKANDNTRLLIGDFSILWNLYEKKLLNIYKESIYDRKRNKIINKYGYDNEKIKYIRVYQEEIHKELIVELKSVLFSLSLERRQQFETEINLNFESLLKHFERFKMPFSDDIIIWYFDVNNNENSKKEVTDIFNEEKQTSEFSEWGMFSKLRLLLIVMYRVRNNMFHGIKEIIKLDDQNDLFIICNNMITLLLGDIESLIDGCGFQGF